MKKKKIIRFSIVISIFIIIFIIVYIINVLDKKNNEPYIYKEPLPEIIPYEMEQVSEYSYFFSVVNILNNYLSYVKDHNNEALFAILHPEYLEEYSINNSNLYDNIGNYENSLQLSFKVKVMDYKKYNDRYLYYVKGDIIENNFELSNIVASDMMYLVNVDYENITYAIYPLNSLYKVLPIIEPEKEISLNYYNELIGSNIVTKDYLCNLYLNDFIWQINNNLDKTYDLLEKDFRLKYYSKKNNYLDYMNNNKNKISSQVFSCSSLSGERNIYEVKDMNFNSFIFTEESIMNYKVEFTLN